MVANISETLFDRLVQQDTHSAVEAAVTHTVGQMSDDEIFALSIAWAKHAVEVHAEQAAA